jgi:hypothetical protein
VLAATGDYSGGIDGIFGPQTEAAMRLIEERHARAYRFDVNSTTELRRTVGCVQAGLTQLKYAPGAVDGWNGVNTTEALNAFLYKTTNGREEIIERRPLENFVSADAKRIPTQDEVDAVYGKPGPEIKSRLVTLELPFKLRIDYNLRQRTNKIRVHQDCATQLERALLAVRAHYGEDDMQRLGLDRFAGAYAHRTMRGGTKWSMHAYGCAVDFYAEPNGLRTECPDALFCGAEYKPFLDIMEENEWLPAIRLWGKDAMHFQRAKLR